MAQGIIARVARFEFIEEYRRARDEKIRVVLYFIFVSGCSYFYCAFDSSTQLLLTLLSRNPPSE